MMKWSTNAEYPYVDVEGKKYTFNYPCQSSQFCFPYYIELFPGIYQFECYGGIGGASSSSAGGKAGITKGIIFIRTKQNFFLYIAAKGIKDDINPVFGGGGTGSSRNDVDGTGGGSGGGASDIRLYEDDLYSRIMVAAGGAGSEHYVHRSALPGGNAGGLTGSSGTKYGTVTPGAGATQDNGGSSSFNPGMFGFGGNSSSLWYGSGGGGGYFGGGGGSMKPNTVSSGGGGSSYIAGYPGCFVNSSFSLYTFFLSQMETGYSGEPKIIITKISSLQLYSCVLPPAKRICFIYCLIIVFYQCK